MAFIKTTVGDTERRILSGISAHPNIEVRFVKEDGSNIRSDKKITIPDIRPVVDTNSTLRSYEESLHLPNLNAKVEFVDKMTGKSLAKNRKVKNISYMEKPTGLAAPKLSLVK